MTQAGLMTEVDVARFMDISVRTLQQWRSRGRGPPWHKLGPKTVRYIRSELISWIESKTYRSTSEYPR